MFINMCKSLLQNVPMAFTGKLIRLQKGIRIYSWRRDVPMAIGQDGKTEHPCPGAVYH